MENKPMFLFGNGLSIALSRDFSLKAITTKFINELQGEEREFLEEICGGKEELSFDDFEENFTSLEAAYSSLKKYRNFIDSQVGQKLMQKFNLTNPKLVEHEKVIESIYRKYILMILELIHGNVKLGSIDERLGDFTKFLINQLTNSDRGYVFTLNYDLLVETILLEKLGTDYFTDFCFPSGYFMDTDIPKYDFNPRRNQEIYDETHRKIELHHLHGSLSLFYDISRNRAFKLKSENIGDAEIYKKIYKEGLPYIPAIITGGGKSRKIVEYPFDFYYRSIKDLCDFGQASKLYIVGYSFRDDHINDLIIRWMKEVENYQDGLLIIDYKTSSDQQNIFKKDVQKSLKKKKPIPDQCFEFNGVNEIHDVKGTIQKKKNK